MPQNTASMKSNFTGKGTDEQNEMETRVFALSLAYAPTEKQEAKYLIVLRYFFTNGDLISPCDFQYRTQTLYFQLITGHG